MNKISKEKLVQLYIDKHMSLKDIADFFSLGQATVLSYMKKYQIPRREAKRYKIPIPDKEVLKQMYYGDSKTIKEIAIFFNVNRNLVNDWFKYHGIQCNYFKTAPSKEDLIRLYIDNNYTVKDLCTVYSVSRKTVNKWLKRYNIEIRSPQRKYYHLRKVPFTRKQKEFIVGTLLGDAYLSKNNVLQIKHGHKQLSYVIWKKEIMSNYVNKIDKRVSDLGICYRWHSITHHEFSRYRKLFYKNNKKVIVQEIANYLTPFSLAIWVMDDGWRQKTSIKISSESFTLEEHELLKSILKSNFGLNAKICTYRRNNKEYNYISFNKRNSILLTEIIKPYVIESLQYKLVPIN